jgi:hypothetical protein
MRNITRLAAAVAACFACSAASAQQPVVLQWQTANLTESQYEPVWKATIAEFEAANPGIRIEPVLVARKDHWTKFVAAAQAKKAPCIVTVDLTTAAYNGYLLPLDKYWNAEPADFRRAWSDAMLSASKWKGQLYGLPIWGGTYAEIYNRDLVTKAGLDPAKPPKNWAEYMTWAKKLSGNDQWATAVLGGKNRHHDARAADVDLVQRRRSIQRRHDRGDVRQEPEEPRGDQVLPRAREGRRGRAGADDHQLPRADQSLCAAEDRDHAQRLLGHREGQRRQSRDEGQGVRGSRPREHSQCPDALQRGRVVDLGQLRAPGGGVEVHQVRRRQEVDGRARQGRELDARAQRHGRRPRDQGRSPAPAVRADRQQRAQLSLPSPIWAEIAANDIVDAVQRALLAPEKTEEIFKDLDAKVTKKLKDV